MRLKQCGDSLMASDADSLSKNSTLEEPSLVDGPILSDRGSTLSHTQM